MTDRGPVTEVSTATGLFVAALVTLAIILLLLFARGPERDERSAVPTGHVVSALSIGGAVR